MRRVLLVVGLLLTGLVVGEAIKTIPALAAFIPCVLTSGGACKSDTTSINGGTTVLTGTGAVGSGAQRIAVGTDTATIAGSAPGTAGTASANVVSVQGIASMTKLLVTPDSVALPANQSVNVSQFGGTNVVTGTGASGSGIPRVTISNDSALAANQSTNVAQFGGTNVVTGTGAGGSGIPRVTISNDSTLAANQSTNIAQINGQTAANGAVTGSLLTEQGCAGQTVANTSVTAINNAGASTSLKLVSKVSAKNIYICSLNLIAAGANNVALVDGTLTTTQCDTSTAGMAGGATAATGWNLAANSGLTVGNGIGVVFKSTSTNLDVCLLFSAANQVSGSITWAQF